MNAPRVCSFGVPSLSLIEVMEYARAQRYSHVSFCSHQTVFQDRLKSEGLYRILQDYDDKSAEAVCTLAFCPAPHADPVIFTGRTKGTIVAPVEGRGFGWDSIFVPDEGDGKPFSCMTTEEKCEVSHRGKAVRQWAEWLGKNQEALFLRQEGQHSVGHKGLDFKATFPEE